MQFLIKAFDLPVILLPITEFYRWLSSVRHSTFGLGTVLQARRLWLWVPVRWIFTQSFQPHREPRVNSASNRNEYQESSWGVKVAAMQGWEPYCHLWADCVENMWEPRRFTTLWPFMACYRHSFTLPFYKDGIAEESAVNRFYLLFDL
jgi:hypothetical protein